MTTEEKKCPHMEWITLAAKPLVCARCGAKHPSTTPPETGREWEKDFDSRFDYSIIESVIRDMGDKATWLDMKKGIKAFIRSIESSALAQGEKIGAEKMVEKIKKSEFATMANQMIPEVMKVFYEEIDALKG